MIQSREGTLHATYSYSLRGQGSSIKHAEFDEAWIREQATTRP